MLTWAKTLNNLTVINNFKRLLVNPNESIILRTRIKKIKNSGSIITERYLSTDEARTAV